MRPTETEHIKKNIKTFSPFALFIALRGLKTLKTLSIFTTEIALDLGGKEKNISRLLFLFIIFLLSNLLKLPLLLQFPCTWKKS